MANVHAMAERTQKDGPRRPWIGVMLRLPPEMRHAIYRVATAKNHSMNAYIRRLIAMSLVKEGEGSLDQWLEMLPYPLGPQNIQIKTLDNSYRHKNDDGAGMEGMCTHPGCDEIHR